LVTCSVDGIKGKELVENLIHMAATIGELQYFKNLNWHALILLNRQYALVFSVQLTYVPLLADALYVLSI